MSLISIIKEEPSIDIQSYFYKWADHEFNGWIQILTIPELTLLLEVMLDKELYEFCCIIRDRLDEIG